MPLGRSVGPAEREVALEAESVGGGRRHPTVVGLRATPGHQRVAAPGEGFGAEMLELSGLVAAERQTGLVVTLDQEARTAEPVGQAVERFERGRPMRQRQRSRSHPWRFCAQR